MVWFLVLSLPLGICTYANTFVSQYFGSRCTSDAATYDDVFCFKFHCSLLKMLWIDLISFFVV